MPKTKVITIPPKVYRNPYSEEGFTRLVTITFPDERAYSLVVETLSANQMGEVLYQYVRGLTKQERKEAQNKH